METSPNDASSGLAKRSAPRAVSTTAVVLVPGAVLAGALAVGPAVLHATHGVAGDVAVGGAAAAMGLSAVYTSSTFTTDRGQRIGLMFASGITASVATGVASSLTFAHGDLWGLGLGGGIATGLIGTFAIGSSAEGRNGNGLSKAQIQNRLNRLTVGAASVAAASVLADVGEHLGAHPIPVGAMGQAVVTSAVALAATATAAAVHSRRGRGSEPAALGE